MEVPPDVEGVEDGEVLGVEAVEEADVDTGESLSVLLDDDGEVTNAAI